MLKRVTIVIALYNPRPDWLREQLNSIEAQDYADIEVIAANDASNSISHGEVAEIFSDCLKRVPYKLFRNDANFGSNSTFELLTQKAEGDYISYSDQDDIWVPEKTKELVLSLAQPETLLAYSDLSVINENGLQIADSLRLLRRRLEHLEGGDLAKALLFRNFTNGTAMMTRTETAKAALPFVKDMVADHWLTLWCAANGNIAYIPRPLVQYRLHGSNQSAVMAGVEGKQSYLERRILPGLSRFEQFEKRLAWFPELRDTILDGQKWFDARNSWFTESKHALEVWRLRHLGKQVSMFELSTARLPEPLFMSAVRLVKQGVL